MSLLGYVNERDYRVSGRLGLWKPPRWFRLFMVGATRAGDGWLWLALGLALALGGERHLRVLAAGAVAAGCASLTFSLLKRQIRRPRPCELLHLAPVVPAPDRYSFPSGHSINAFALATVPGLQLPWLAPLVALAAASIAASRVVLGLHFLSDVLAGAQLGVLIGASSYLLLLG